MNLAAKGAIVAGLVGLVAIGGTKPGGNDPLRLGQKPLSVTRTVMATNAPPFSIVEVRTSGVSLVVPSTNAVVSESVRRRGTSEARILPRRFAEVRRFAPDVHETAGEYWDAEPVASFKQHSERHSLHA